MKCMVGDKERMALTSSVTGFESSCFEVNEHVALERGSMVAAQLNDPSLSGVTHETEAKASSTGCNPHRLCWMVNLTSTHFHNQMLSIRISPALPGDTWQEAKP